MDNTSLRQAMRQRRRQLKVVERTLLSQQLTARLLQQAFFNNSQTIACYWPFDGEIDTLLIIKALWKQNRHCYLPVINTTSRSLHFARYKEDSRLHDNRYGIAEPLLENSTLPVQQLDLVLLPLVAFDAAGHRLGTGGGYYDRSLQTFNVSSRPDKPVLIGLAYEWQKMDSLQPQSWDIMLDGIMTDQAFYPTTARNPI